MPKIRVRCCSWKRLANKAVMGFLLCQIASLTLRERLLFLHIYFPSDYFSNFWPLRGESIPFKNILEASARTHRSLRGTSSRIKVLMQCFCLSFPLGKQQEVVPPIFKDLPITVCIIWKSVFLSHPVPTSRYFLACLWAHAPISSDFPWKDQPQIFIYIMRKNITAYQTFKKKTFKKKTNIIKTWKHFVSRENLATWMLKPTS